MSGFEAWIGREEEKSERILASVVETMAATLDLERAPVAGDALPPGWQWLFFNPKARRSALGVDGHPARGGFLPPVELPRRMWAGSRIRYLAPIPVEADATKHSKILKVEEKTGKRGSLCFVTVEHTTIVNGKVCIVEEQDIVYKEATPPSAAPAPTPARHEAVAQWSQDFTPDTTLLFRFSALTFNGHRIHYDQPYVTGVEGYPGFIVHGPLMGMVQIELARRSNPGRTPASFEFRALAPVYAGASFSVHAKRESDGSVSTWIADRNGGLAQQGKATFR